MENEIIKKSAEAKKNVMQDVLPPKRSIRDVAIPFRRRTSVEAPIVPPPVKKEELSYKYEYDEPVKPSKKWFYVSVCVLVLALAFGISAFFKSAVIKVTPLNQVYDLNADFTAKKDDTSGGLAFQIVTVSKDLEETVPATGQEQVDTKAAGQIVIFNNYSSASQKLVATTRFQTPEGLIFRLVSAVNVPGRQTVNGQSVPGSVQAAVVADQSGDKYNIPLEDFTIPGFKGGPRYSQIYARSKTPMTGGFSGLQKTVNDQVMASTSAELETNLKTFLQTNIVSQIPDNFVLYPDALSYSFSPIEQASSTDSDAVLKQTGTAYAVIFDKGLLSRAIISNVLPSAANDVIKITNLENLTFSYQTGQTFDPSDSDTVLNFNLSGQPDFVWVFDENKLKSDILGLSKKQAVSVIGSYKTITDVLITTTPFWNQTIPTDPNKVTLINTLAN
jgi:hypothetical protein